MNYGTLTTGKPDWLKQVEAKRKPIIVGGIIYQEKDIGTRGCLIVKNYVDLTNCAVDFNELLCFPDKFETIIDLGNAPKDHDLLINPESGKVYVNGYAFNGMTSLMSLGDGSWGISINHNFPRPRKGFVGWLTRVYESWLEEVYKKCNYFGLIEINDLHVKSIRHLIVDNLPKGAIRAKKSKISA